MINFVASIDNYWCISYEMKDLNNIYLPKSDFKDLEYLNGLYFRHINKKLVDGFTEEEKRSYLSFIGLNESIIDMFIEYQYKNYHNYSYMSSTITSN